MSGVDQEKIATLSHSYLKDVLLMVTDCYLKMLQNYFLPQFTRLELMEETVFQQDGAPCHFAFRVKQYLYEKFPNRWTGSAGPNSWPPGSPGVHWTSFHGNMKKTTIYSTKPRSIDDLQAKITNVIQGITEIQLQSAFLELQNHITVSIRNNCGHVKN